MQFDNNHFHSTHGKRQKCKNKLANHIDDFNEGLN